METARSQPVDELGVAALSAAGSAAGSSRIQPSPRGVAARCAPVATKQTAAKAKVVSASGFQLIGVSAGRWSREFPGLEQGLEPLSSDNGHAELLGLGQLGRSRRLAYH